MHVPEFHYPCLTWLNIDQCIQRSSKKTAFPKVIWSSANEFMSFQNLDCDQRWRYGDLNAMLWHDLDVLSLMWIVAAWHYHCMVHGMALEKSGKFWWVQPSVLDCRVKLEALTFLCWTKLECVPLLRITYFVISCICVSVCAWQVPGIGQAIRWVIALILTHERIEILDDQERNIRHTALL
jgi:hypothetical protein